MYKANNTLLYLMCAVKGFTDMECVRHREAAVLAIINMYLCMKE